MYYYGCFDNIGHHLYNTHYDRINMTTQLPDDFPVFASALDGAFLFPKGMTQEGNASWVLIGNWTIISFSDRSVDKRLGSNSSFVIRGRHTFDAAVELAKATFQQIWQRFTFEVKLAGYTA